VDTPVTLGIAGFGQGYAPGSFLWIVNNLYFQYYSLFIFTVSVLVMIGVSYVTKPPAPESLEGLTYATVTAVQRDVSRASWTRFDVIASTLVLLAIIVVYVSFSG
jgi:SSS family solute:Na+ symporter